MYVNLASTGQSIAHYNLTTFLSLLVCDVTYKPRRNLPRLLDEVCSREHTPYTRQHFKNSLR